MTISSPCITRHASTQSLIEFLALTFNKFSNFWKAPNVTSDYIGETQIRDSVKYTNCQEILAYTQSLTNPLLLFSHVAKS